MVSRCVSTSSDSSDTLGHACAVDKLRLLPTRVTELQQVEQQQANGKKQLPVPGPTAFKTWLILECIAK